jgi:uncharacterized protein with beta-barrel porin domain
MTSSKVAAGNGVSSVGADGSRISVVARPTIDAQDALDQRSGEIHASLQTSLLQTADRLRMSALRRLTRQDDGAVASSRGQLESRGPAGGSFRVDV